MDYDFLVYCIHAAPLDEDNGYPIRIIAQNVAVVNKPASSKKPMNRGSISGMSTKQTSQDPRKPTMIETIVSKETILL